MLKNNEITFGSVAKIFHWFMAITIFCLLIVGFNLKSLGIPVMYKVHKTIGFMILMLVPIRLLWRLYNISPKYEQNFPRKLQFIAALGHYTLYVLMFLVPLSAFIASNATHRSVSFLFLFDMKSFFAEPNIELAKMAMEVHGILSVN